MVILRGSSDRRHDAAPPDAAPPDPAGLPLLRALGSPVMRWALGLLLLATGWLLVGQLLLARAADPDGNFAADFADYHRAAARLIATGTPYASEMLEGPLDAIGRDRYRYPPPLAQVLAPIAGLPERTAATVYLAFQAVAILAAVWIAARAGGARRSLETALWCGVAVAWFLPAYDTLWEGNVGGFLALCIALAALGGRTGAAAAVVATFLKVAPVFLLPAVIGTRRGLAAALATTAAILAVSVVLVPAAWADYAVVLPNMLAGSARNANNLAPAAVTEQLLGPGFAATAVRLLTLGAVALCSVLSFLLGRRPDGIKAAVLLGTVAMLLLPAVTWFHYLVVLLPLAAMTWPGATRRLRLALLGAAAVTSVAMIVGLPLATAGATAMVLACARGLWPATPAGRPIGRAELVLAPRG